MSFVETFDTDFPIENIPFGVISAERHCATAIGIYALDLKLVADAGLFSPLIANALSMHSLNKFMGLGRAAWREARATIQKLLQKGSPHEALIKTMLNPLSAVKMHLPAEIGDYTDFYSSKEHATNIGTMFRGKDNALMPNWVHIPVGYHGRASSVVVSGTPIRRPSGMVMNQQSKQPEFSKCQKLDIELEMAFFVGVGNELGQPISIEAAEDHIFGCVLMNDWSARDIQQFEYVPLGPFLGKDPIPSSYLIDSNNSKDAYDVHLQVKYKPKGSSKFHTVVQSNLKYMYWTFKQQLAHHTVNGCNMKSGDLCGTGTLSGPTKISMGSFLELTANGKEPIQMEDMSRTFLEDGDEIEFNGICIGKSRIGFGACSGVIIE